MYIEDFLLQVLTDLKLIAVVLGIAGVTTFLLLIGEACPFLRGHVVLVDDSHSHAHGGEDHVQVTGYDEHEGEHEAHEEYEHLGEHPDHNGFTNVRSVVQTIAYITIIVMIASSRMSLTSYFKINNNSC